jgi:hypothetical protein
MFSAVEFHDSNLLAVRASEPGVTLQLDAYVHRWERVDKSWHGSGWMQTVDVVLPGSRTAVSSELPLRISGGTVTVGHTRYDNMVFLPLTIAGPTTLRLELENGEALEVVAQGFSMLTVGPGRFVESLPADCQPEFGLPSSMRADASEVAYALFSEHPAFADTFLPLENGHFEASVSAPTSSRAGALVVRTAHNGDIWVHLAPPQMWYSADDANEMLSVLAQLFSDQARFVRIENGNGEWVRTTLLGPNASPDLEEGQRATIISWSGQFDSEAS